MREEKIDPNKKKRGERNREIINKQKDKENREREGRGGGG